MDFLAPIRSSDVKDLKSYSCFCQQTLGVPLLRRTDISALQKQTKDIFNQYPRADWQSFVKVAYWARSRNKRFAHLRQLVACWRYALQDGCLPELAFTYEDSDLEAQIIHAVEIEKDKEWVFSLRAAKGPHAQREVFQAWQTARSSSPSLA